jgi:hypothetical protein
VVFRGILELDVLIVKIINLFGLIKALAVGDSFKFTKCGQNRWGECFGRVSASVGNYVNYKAVPILGIRVNLSFFTWLLLTCTSGSHAKR